MFYLSFLPLLLARLLEQDGGGEGWGMNGASEEHMGEQRLAAILSPYCKDCAHLRCHRLYQLAAKSSLPHINSQPSQLSL